MAPLNSKQKDLAELGLKDETPTETQIRKAYVLLAKTRHPDKGGTTDSFQKLVNAYERLNANSYQKRTPASSAGRPKPSRQQPESEEESEEDDDAGDDSEFWYEAHFNFFHGWEGFYHEDFDDEDEEYFRHWYKSEKQRYTRQRREDIKRGYDRRDQKAHGTDEEESCMFCGENQGIKKEDAESSGLKWEEYIQHPAKYRTCWACLRSHKSVMTKSMALKKFGKKLDYQIESSKGGLYHPVFWFLQLHEKTFHYQPNIGRLTLNSQYFWYPDLEEEALERGWKPRGHDKLLVPWKRKDVGATKKRAIVVTPQRAQKRQRKKRAV